jgi:hypothetical protein
MAQQPVSRPMDDMVQVMSEQAAVLVREQLELARREMTGKVKQARAGAAMIGGAGVLAALASGTGTAALVLLLSRRPGPSAAALGVTGAYAGAGALLAREGLERLKQATPLVPEKTVQNAKGSLGSAKRSSRPPRPKQAAKQRPESTARRTTNAERPRRSRKPAPQS